MADEKADNLEIGHSLNHYRIVKKIGAGGMGEIFLAEDTRLERRVALKVLPEDLAGDTERMRRFVLEAKATSALNHPNILTIYEIGESENTNYIAAEYVEGATLRERLRAEPLDLKSALDVAVQITSALQAAHGAGVVHRDVKPDNVMIRPDGLAKLLDFGIAKLTEKHTEPIDAEAATAIEAHTETGMLIGTAAYMSPEQARGKAVDARSDIFSFGLVLYEMLTGKAAFEGESAMDVIGLILHTEPLPLVQQMPNVPREIERIIGKALRKDCEERYQTAKDLLIDLKDARQELEFQNKLERTAAPDTKPAETQIFKSATDADQLTSSAKHTSAEVKKHKFGLVALSVLILAAAGFGYWYFFSQKPDVKQIEKQIESIAVMPFVNESGNADNEYLSDGMTETLISSLSQLPNLSVKARSSVFRYKGKDVSPQIVGNELAVQAVLIGRVIQRGEQLTLSLELVDVKTQNVIWSENYNRKQADLISLQSEIARDVSQKLKTKLSGADEQRLAKNYTKNPKAFQLYLKGRFYWNKRTPQDLQRAIEYFNQAIAVDPNYALGYAGLADTYALRSNYRAAPPHETMPKAKDAALKALSLDNNLAEAHTALGLILHIYDYDFAGAEREHLRAIELNPNYATGHHFYGIVLSYLGRHEEALAQLERALEIDPFSLVLTRTYGDRLIFARRYDDAITHLKKTLELGADSEFVHFSLGIAYQIKGDHAEAVEEYAKYQEQISEPQTAAIMRESYSKSGWQGFLRVITEKRIRFNSPLDNLATFYAALGEKDKAFAELNKSYENRENIMVQLKVDPRLDPLRDDPRFQELLRKVGFPQ